MSKRSLLDALVSDIDNTTQGRKRYRKHLKQRADPPTLEQFKKLFEEGEAIVQLTGEPLNAATLFLAMLPVITVQVKETNHTYWVYIPNPPINKGMRWGDMTIPVVVKELSRLPGPYDHRGSAMPEEESKEIVNNMVGMQGIPI